MKWWKTLLGIALVAVAVYAMYIWNSKGRAAAAAEQAAVMSDLKSVQSELEQAKSELEQLRAEDAYINPMQDIFDAEMSFFELKKDWIYSKSCELASGDYAAIYFLPSAASGTDISRIGVYRIVTIDSNTIEIACTDESYFAIYSMIEPDCSRIKDEEFLYNGKLLLAPAPEPSDEISGADDAEIPDGL